MYALPNKIIAAARKTYDARVLGRGLTEMRLVWNLLNDLRDAGFTVSKVNDGEEWIKAHDIREAFDTVFSVDDSVLSVNASDGERTGWIVIVLGNDGIDAISDYGYSEGTEFQRFLDKWTQDTERFL